MPIIGIIVVVVVIVLVVKVISGMFSPSSEEKGVGTKNTLATDQITHKEEIDPRTIAAVLGAVTEELSTEPGEYKIVSIDSFDISPSSDDVYAAIIAALSEELGDFENYCISSIYQKPEASYEEIISAITCAIAEEIGGSLEDFNIVSIEQVM